MNMKKGFLLGLSLLMIIALSGCINKGYKVSKYKEDPSVNLLEMKTYDLESEWFNVRYSPADWTLEEWAVEEAPNKVALVHVSSDDRYQCVLLPGTIGQGLQEGNQATEGSLLTRRFVGRTIDIYNPIGIHLMHVVGYEVNGIPYIFETRLPSRDPQTCELASQAVVSSFNVGDSMELPEEEIEEEVVEVEADVDVEEITEPVEVPEENSAEEPAS
jgi:hypothetical protein